MVFDFPHQPHIRQHEPVGYSSYERYKPWLRDEFSFRCAYCLMRETWDPYPEGSYGTDHFVAQVHSPRLSTVYNNLVYACTRCNSFKSDRQVLDPCSEAYGQHLEIDLDGKIHALTADGHAHIAILQLDEQELTEYRRQLIETIQLIMSSGHPKADALLNRWLGFPFDLPNLAALRPPRGNNKPEGVASCYYRQRKLGVLPARY